MKKPLSILLSFLLIITSISCCFGLIASAAVLTLTEEEIANKNYPIPAGFEVKSVYGTYDKYTNGGSGTLCSEEGNFYDKSSLAIVSKQGAYEKIGVSKVRLDGIGFMFWYKTDIRHTVRIRRASDINIIAEIYLDPCAEGRWVTFYYYGKYSNMYFKGDMSSDIRKNIKDTDYNVQFMTSASNKTIYIDEFFTFGPETTAADSYENDEQALKFSSKRFINESTTKAEYFEDGSVILSSTYGSSANKSPFSINYNADPEQFVKAVNEAKKGSGFLQINVENISCLSSSGADSTAQAEITFYGIGKSIKQYIYGTGTTETMLLNAAKIDNPEAITTVNVKVTGLSAIKNVKFKFSPITVYHYPDDEIILQAEDLNPKTSVGVATIGTTSDGNRSYVANSSKVDYISFELPELEVGEYDVYAVIYAKVCNTKYHISLNNLRKYVDVPFTDAKYSSLHFTKAEIGTLQITKNYSDGPTVLKLSFAPNAGFEIRVDYFSFKKTDTVVEAEPASNFVKKDYPLMEDYEVKTILSTYNDYICGSDERYYLDKQLAGYVGDGNAYNLNSRGTLNWGYSDANTIWNGYGSYLNGDGIRFWFKGSGGTIRFSTDNTIKYSYNLGWYSKGTWITIYYKDLVKNGDLSDINRISYKTAGNTNPNYIDELHTIQEKLGDITYELSGDGTASVVGYRLRLEDVEILPEYKGCPVTTIKEGALSGSLTLKSVVIPNSVTTIEANAFLNDPNLTTVTFGNGLTKVEDNAFKGCVKLNNVTLPKECKNVSNIAFDGCTSLYININSDYIKEYCANNLIDYIDVCNDFEYYFDFKNESKNVKILSFKGDSKDIEIPSTIDETAVTIIGSEALKDNSTIETVILPQTVVTIESSAFKNCKSLKSVSMKCVQKIGEGAFSGCTSLERVDVSDELLTIAASAFYNCTEIKEFYFGDYITSIGENAFYNCNFVADLSDEAYTTRNSYSYKYVSNNRYKNYPTTNSEFEYYIVKEIATICGYKGNGGNILIPSRIDDYIVENIDKNAFKDNKTLTSIRFEGNVRIIDEYAFYGCENLSSVIFESSLRKIFAYAFVNCKSLLSVNINNVVSVHEKAFDETTKISRVQTDFIRNAVDYVDGMTAGWNLGNTMDAHSYKYSYGDLTVYEHEHSARWYDYITQDLFDLVAKSFNTIRIPITWNVFINPNNDYTIDEDFMDRIQEIVDMCYTAGFKYIIINTHHDSDYYFNVHPSNPDYDNAEYILSRVWEQICERFEEYDEKLIFESMNEIRAQDKTVENDHGDWYGHDTTYFDKLNSLNKAFYETVRSSGGNNNRRYLMIQTYGGQKDFHQINKLWLPSVSTDDHIIPSVHWYIESSNPAHYYAVLDGLTQKFLDRGMPCVIGEIGLARWINDDAREVWAQNAFGLFEQYGIKAIIWEDHGDYSTITYDNGTYTWTYPKYITEIAKMTAKNEVDENQPLDIVIDDVHYATLSYGSSVKLPKSNKTNFIAYFDGTNYYDEGELIIIKESLDLKTLYLGEVKMSYGAAMRLSEKSGLRFYTEFDTNLLDRIKSLGVKVDIGTIIAFKDRLPNNDITFETEKYNSKNALVWTTVPYLSDKYYNEGRFKGIVGSIVNITTANISKKFVGRGYFSFDLNGKTKTIYADFAEDDIANNSRSIAYVAYQFKNNNYGNLDLSDDYIAMVNNWASYADPYVFDRW